MPALTDPKWAGPWNGQEGMAVRTLGCGGSDPRWAGMAPEVTKNKTMILAKGAFAHDTSLDTASPIPGESIPKFFYPFEAIASPSNLSSLLLPLAIDLC